MDRFEQLIQIAPDLENVEIVYERLTIRKGRFAGEKNGNDFEEPGTVPVYTPIGLTPDTTYQASGSSFIIKADISADEVPLSEYTAIAGKDPGQCNVRVQSAVLEGNPISVAKVMTEIEPSKKFEQDEMWDMHFKLRNDVKDGTVITIIVYNDWLQEGSAVPATVIVGKEPK